MKLGKFIDFLMLLKEDQGDLDVKLSFDDLEFEPTVVIKKEYAGGKETKGKMFIVREKEEQND